MQTYHTPVFLDEIIEALRIVPGAKYIDATIGGGGHGLAIVRRGGIVLGIDADREALAHTQLKVQSEKFKVNKDIFLWQGNFREIDTIAHLHGFDNVRGILLDLGVSSWQLDTPTRGFSFQKSGPLDMRMDTGLMVTAADLINGLTKKELVMLFSRFGQEHRGNKIAEAIVKARLVSPITTTDGLTQVIGYALGLRNTDSLKVRAALSKRVFQALRIAVNDELTALSIALPKAEALLETGGRLAVVTFHSLEDEIVKHTFLSFEKEGKGRVVTKKPLVPTEKEQKENRRSRSAKLRIFERK